MLVSSKMVEFAFEPGDIVAPLRFVCADDCVRLPGDAGGQRETQVCPDSHVAG